MLMLKAIEIEIAFVYSLRNSKGRTLYYFFCALHIRHNFPRALQTDIHMDELFEIFLKYVINENIASAFNY